MLLVAATSARAEDWPTAGHDFQRTSFTATAPAPPYRLRWLWVNGDKLPPGQLKAPRGQIQAESFPDFLGVRFSSLAQPMVRGGLACIGSTEGRVFAIDVSTGQTRWQAAASGAILHSLSLSQDALYAATLRGVDAFAWDGQKLWTFEEPRPGGFWCSPAIDAGIVLAGGFSGFFYGLDARTGKRLWEFEADGPIYHSPAIHEGTVFFGAEDMCVYALDIATGRLRWKSRQLAGVSFGHYWPVVAAQAGVLLVRTSPIQRMVGSEIMPQAPDDYDQTQELLRRYFEDNPGKRSFFMLDLATGNERALVASGHFGSQGDLSPPPIVRQDGSILAWHYARNGVMQTLGRWHHYGFPADLGLLDPRTGLFQRLGPPDTSRPPAFSRIDDYHQNTLGGRWLFGHQSGNEWGAIPLDAKTPAAYFRCLLDTRKFHSLGKQGLLGFVARNEHGTLGPTLLPGMVLINAFDGICVAAYESGQN